ncbi:MAG: PD40 domain-containing protein [Bacteroidales bacterium]|nr:PD40 domain-containing protein [Bacteroidales bacterium]
MKKLIIILLFFCAFVSLKAQKDSIAIAEDLIYNQDFNSAINFYKEIISMDPKNPDHQYRIGFCYLNTSDKRDSSIVPFKKFFVLYDDLSKKKKRKVMTNPLEVKFYLARSYRVNFLFDSALVVLNQMVEETKNKRTLEVIENEILMCNDGKLLVENPVNIEIENLGNIINTNFTEHTPVFSADESELIFTSRKKLFTDNPLDFDGEYDENIYISVKDTNGNWLVPDPIKSINTRSHEATISMSSDGTKLFVYRDEDDGSIFYSEFAQGYWLPTVKLGENINTKYRETHASLSYDGTTLYFTSDRPGGFGGLDIYMSEKMPDGKWGKAVNMGPGINTKKDEESPFILPDGKTLYFSSKGHGGLGGYDIFKSTMTEFGTWSLPKNIGYPINSIEDDVFFFPTPDEKRAYFSSKKGSGFGSSDIYLMKMPESEGSNLVVMTGKLTVCQGELPYADVLITDNTTGDYYIATPKNGKFIFVTEKGHNYNVTVEVDGNVVFTEDFDVMPDAPRIQLYKAIRLDPNVPCENLVTISDDDLIDPKRIDASGNIYDNYVEIDNILFPLNGVGKIEPNKTLDTLSSFLIRNPSAKIQVGGYCDASGKASYNYTLGLKRANAVKFYLVNSGVNPEQITAVSYGEENPIAINKNKDGNWNRDGQQLNRRVEFRVLEQADETLLIWGMKVPDEIKNPNYKFNYKKADRNDLEIEN